jgi:hypothetical protein
VLLAAAMTERVLRDPISDPTGVATHVAFASAGRTAPEPDRFSYVFVLGGQEVTVQEQDLTDDLRRLADLAPREERSEAR